MSASQIPNLNTLRRGGARLRGRGRGGGELGSDAPSRRGGSSTKDRVVQGTDNDASVSRLSAVNLGYLDDPFASALTPPGQETRRLPIINRGTYVRTTTIDHLLTQFLHPSTTPHRPDTDTPQRTPTTPTKSTIPTLPQPKPKQIISLGAGSDTRIFRLLAQTQTQTQTQPHPEQTIIYHELDFPSNTASKIRAIRAAPHLQRALGDPQTVTISPAADALHTPHYHLHPIDLRQLAALASSPPSRKGDLGNEGADLRPDTLLPGLDPTLPTVLISECCLIYLEPEEARRVVEFFVGVFDASVGEGKAEAGAGAGSGAGADGPPPTPPLGIILYEPIRPDDAFGRTMVANLATRGIQLQTLHRYASLAAQRARLRAHGFVDGQAAADVDFLWERWVAEGEKERVAGLEMLDEMEEWRLLARHYCVAWGWREGGGRQQHVFEGWRGLETQQGED
ncbi:protein C-terminal leucine carboxyl O-methyltransferase ppm1 [Aspergillus fijiensis CBS 313.89]|uniref:Leucine carboxyl methyltransferase 1 n=1 Tax=Aspergillus fijiensis CBS 313.89 TaxID=1448319 RepID=A0A8G1RHW6_9EURO|nr:leucine carboxyl methyltransferase [Aspergillus fijiensis CBS 313.89]RAK73655.1 leucine carboxyl methyltransferase [Aspergillus fijiensis CBS 313.89]